MDKQKLDLLSRIITNEIISKKKEQIIVSQEEIEKIKITLKECDDLRDVINKFQEEYNLKRNLTKGCYSNNTDKQIADRIKTAKLAEIKYPSVDEIKFNILCSEDTNLDTIRETLINKYAQ